jgi:hypothetical protein
MSGGIPELRQLVEDWKEFYPWLVDNPDRDENDPEQDKPVDQEDE